MPSIYLKIKKPFKVYTILIASLGFAIFLLSIFGDHPKLVEKYYTNGFYRILSLIGHPVVRLIPFSLGDVIYIIIIILLIYAIIIGIYAIIKKKLLLAGILGLRLILGIEIFIVLFYMLWGLNYSRPSASELLGLRDSIFSTVELKNVTAQLIDSANACRDRVNQADLLQNNKVIYTNACKAIQSLSANNAIFKTYGPGVKPSIITPLLNYIGTAGYFNPLTGEAQINSQMPVFTRSVVACHEMSHQMGFAAEDEANFVGYLAGIGSNDHLLRYSAYQLAVGEFMRALYLKDSLINKALKLRVSKKVHQDFITERDYWRYYQGKLNKISGIFYDGFLKVNKQPQGIDTYNKMVILVMAMHKAKKD
jgi:hypothetical protein